MKTKKILITLMICSGIAYITNNTFNITAFVNTKIEIIKDKEMKYICGELDNSVDTYNKKQHWDSEEYSIAANNEINGSIEYPSNSLQSYMFLQNQNSAVEADKSMIFNVSKEKQILSELKNKIEEDSYRNRHFGIYYIFMPFGKQIESYKILRI